MGKHSYIRAFGKPDINRGECSVSESRVREIRLHGSIGGLPMCDSLFMTTKGGLPWVRQGSLAYLVGLNPTHLKPNQQGDTKLSIYKGNRVDEARVKQRSGRNASEGIELRNI